MFRNPLEFASFTSYPQTITYPRKAIMKKLASTLSVIALASVALVGCSADETPVAESTTESTVQAVDNQEWADKQYKALLTNYGAKSQSEMLAKNPGSVQSYLVSAESPSSGTVVFTAQLTEADVDKGEVEQGAMAVLNLIGFSDESVDRVEIVTADSKVRGVANRHDSPMLNK